MRTVFTILWRDIKRLVKVPSAWIVIFGITLLPAAYAWFNIYGFWDPYGNTQNIRVAVANEDTGTTNATIGKLNLGDQIVAQLKENKQIGWTFYSREDALDQVKSGKCYAALIMPKDFSKELVAAIMDGGERPALEYYVNEKANAMATKITNTAASTLDTKINDTFVSTVSKSVGSVFNKTNDQIQDTTDTTVSKAVSQLNATEQTIKDVQADMKSVTDTLDGVPARTDSARSAVQKLKDATSQTGTGLSDASKQLTSVQTKVNAFGVSTSNALDKSGSLLTQTMNKANTDVTNITTGVTQATGTVSSAITQLKSVNSQNQQLLEALQGIDTSNMDANTRQALETLIAQLETANQNSSTMLDQLNTLNTDTANTASSTQKLSDNVTKSADTAIGALSDARNTISSDAMPKLNNALTTLSTTSGSLGSLLTSQSSSVDDLNSLLDQLDSVSASTSSALKDTSSLLTSLSDSLDTVKTDLVALQNANTFEQLTGINGDLDVSRIATFMLSPTVLKTHNLYPVSSYGSSMAPLFTSLALWVAGFMQMSVMKLEVDDEGMEKLMPSAGQKFVARFLLLALISFIQCVTIATGDVIIGIQTINPFLFILTGWFAGLSYLALEYALSATFLQVGKGLCMVLVMVQIPAGSGLYPLELMPKFFTFMHPIFPFSYAISAFRETIGGFYGTTWIKDMLVLAIFIAFSMFLGLVIRPRMTNFNRMFAREALETDLLIGEEVMLPDRRISIAKAIQILADKTAFRKDIEERANRFERLYPLLKRGALIAGIVIPIILLITFSLTTGTKVIAMGTWIVLVLLMIIFLLTIEYIHDNLLRQVDMGNLSDEAIQSLVVRSEHKRKRAQALLKLTDRIVSPSERGERGERSERGERGSLADRWDRIGRNNANDGSDANENSSDKSMLNRNLREADEASVPDGFGEIKPTGVEGVLGPESVSDDNERAVPKQQTSGSEADNTGGSGGEVANNNHADDSANASSSTNANVGTNSGADINSDSDTNSSADSDSDSDDDSTQSRHSFFNRFRNGGSSSGRHAA